MCEVALLLQHVPILLHNVAYRGWSANVCTLHDPQGTNLKCDVASFPCIVLTCYANLNHDVEKLSYPHALAGGYHHGLECTWDQ